MVNYSGINNLPRSKYTFDTEYGDVLGFLYDFDGDFVWYRREMDSMPFYKISVFYINKIIDKNNTVVWNKNV